MGLSPSTSAAADARFVRFRPLFEAQAFALDKLFGVFEEYRGLIKVRQGPERHLSLLVALSVGKGAKTCSAVRYLCWLGYGEDAAILVRANLNLLINLGYILSDPEPLQRTAEFLAYTHCERQKYLRLAHGVDMPMSPPVPAEKLCDYARAWKDMSIETRAQRAGLKDFHYNKAYRLLSSTEHSDAFSLNALLGEWNEVGPTIRGEDDNGVDLALYCNYVIASDLTFATLRYFGIERPDITEALRAKLSELEAWDKRASAG